MVVTDQEISNQKLNSKRAQVQEKIYSKVHYRVNSSQEVTSICKYAAIFSYIDSSRNSAIQAALFARRKNVVDYLPFVIRPNFYMAAIWPPFLHYRLLNGLSAGHHKPVHYHCVFVPTT